MEHWFGYGQDAKDTLDAVNQLAAWVESKESEWWVDLLDPDQSVLEAIRISESSTKPVVIAEARTILEPEGIPTPPACLGPC